MGTYQLDMLLLTSLCPWSPTVLPGSAVHPHFCCLKGIRDSLTNWCLLRPLRPIKGPLPHHRSACGLELSSGPTLLSNYGVGAWMSLTTMLFSRLSLWALHLFTLILFGNRDLQDVIKVWNLTNPSWSKISKIQGLGNEKKEERKYKLRDMDVLCNGMQGHQG